MGLPPSIGNAFDEEIEIDKEKINWHEEARNLALTIRDLKSKLKEQEQIINANKGVIEELEKENSILLDCAIFYSDLSEFSESHN